MGRKLLLVQGWKHQDKKEAKDKEELFALQEGNERKNFWGK